jgi:hypothetical protein
MSDAWVAVAENLTPEAAQQAVKRLRAQDIEARAEAGRVLVPQDVAADAEAVLADAAAADAEVAAAPGPHAHDRVGGGITGADARELLGDRGFAPATPAPAAAPGSESEGPTTTGLLVMLVVLSGLALLVMKSCA